MGLGIHALAVEAEVLGERVDEGAVVGWHRFEAETLFVSIRGEDAEFTFLRLGPYGEFVVLLEGGGGVGDMVVLVGFGVNVKCECEFAVALEACTFVVALEGLFGVAFAGFGGVALHFLLEVLTVACDEHFALARLVFLTGCRCMAELFTRVATSFLGFPAELLASPPHVFAIAGSMAWFSTEMGAATELPTTYFTTSSVGKPAWLILQFLLAAHARLLYQEGALGARLLVAVAIVRDLRMATTLWSFAFKSAGRRSRATWQRRLKNGSSTVAGNLVENSLTTASARAFMTKFWAWMIAAFQYSTTKPSTDVFSLEAVVVPWCSTKRTQLSLRCQPFRCSTFSLTTMLATLVSPAVERGFTDAHTLRWFIRSLVTDS